MNKCTELMDEGHMFIDRIINKADSTTPFQEPEIKRGLEAIVQTYGPRDPATGAPIVTHGMPIQNLQKIAKNAMGAVHYHKMFKGLPNYVEEFWKDVSKDLGQVFAYTKIAKNIEKLGAEYGIKGKMENGLKDKIEGYIKTLEDLQKGKANDETVEKIANEFADGYMEMLEKTVDKDDPLSEQEKRDYRTLIVTTLKDNKRFGANLMISNYAPKVEKELKDSETAILAYTKSIADGVHKETPGDLGRNYEKFNKFEDKLREVATEVKGIRNEYNRKKGARVEIDEEE